ncbi:heme transporter [Gordonia terrae]|uniref:heme transporter n=1 Tax=Gordonia terrae TaxID=2055 RepID=UPI003F6AFDF3
MTGPAEEYPPAHSDLEILLRTAGFCDSSVIGDVDAVTAHLPALGQVVGVTVAGPVIMNAVGVHATPVSVGGPIRAEPDRITLRLCPSRLSSTLLSDPAAHVPPTLRLFDDRGNTSHATYLTENSDRLAFEGLSLGRETEGSRPSLVGPVVPEDTALQDPALPDLDDQVAQLDSILSDGGSARHAALAATGDARATRVNTRPVIAALEHAALLGMTVTLAATAPGCAQMRQDRLDGAREHRGQMVLASGNARVMVNFNLVGDCWVTWTQGVRGLIGSLEIYNRKAQCCLVVTQTGVVAPEVAQAWDQLMADLIS